MPCYDILWLQVHQKEKFIEILNWISFFSDLDHDLQLVKIKNPASQTVRITSKSSIFHIRRGKFLIYWTPAALRRALITTVGKSADFRSVTPPTWRVSHRGSPLKDAGPQSSVSKQPHGELTGGGTCGKRRCTNCGTALHSDQFGLVFQNPNTGASSLPPQVPIDREEEHCGKSTLQKEALMEEVTDRAMNGG